MYRLSPTSATNYTMKCGGMIFGVLFICPCVCNTLHQSTEVNISLYSQVKLHSSGKSLYIHYSDIRYISNHSGICKAKASITIMIALGWRVCL